MDRALMRPGTASASATPSIPVVGVNLVKGRAVVVTAASV